MGFLQQPEEAEIICPDIADVKIETKGAKAASHL